jgi:hypothetical protein
VTAAVARASQLRAEVVGRVLRDGEEELVDVEPRSIRQLETLDCVAAIPDARNRVGENADVVRVELVAVLRRIDVGWAAVGADDDVARPRREVQRHRHGLSAGTDHGDPFAARIEAVAIRAHVRVGAVNVLQTGNVGPHVAQSDREQEPVGGEAPAPFHAHDEAIVVPVVGAEDQAVAQRDSELAAGLPPAPAQIGGAHTRQPEIAVDAERLPVARVAAVDDHHGVEIARQPDRRAQPGGSSADDRYVVVLASVFWRLLRSPRSSHVGARQGKIDSGGMTVRGPAADAGVRLSSARALHAIPDTRRCHFNRPAGKS